MNTMPLLTIAIPTYNRVKLLEETLVSVIPQVTPQVEVLVCSNASQDGTDELMADYCSRYPFIRYLKSEVNRGIDANMHKCTEEARGEFVHLLSDDDILMPGTVDELFAKIDAYPEADFFFWNICSFHAPLTESSRLPPNFTAVDDIVYTDRNAFFEYVWVFSTLMSSFVLRRRIWRAFADRERYIGTDIYLTYALFAHVARSRCVVMLARPGVAVRAEYTGNYRIFYAFAYQWGTLLLKTAPVWGYDPERMKRIFRKTIAYDLPKRVYSIRSQEIKSNFDMKSLCYLFHYTWKFPAAWIYLVTAFFLPKRVHSKLYFIDRMLMRRSM